MNCIIGADKISCKFLEEFVRKTAILNLIGTYNDLESIKNHLSRRRDIDLIILDNDMSEMDFFNNISGLDYQPNIVIVASDDQNALKAFDLNVVDYLLKPVTYSRFYKAVDKVIRYSTYKKSNKNEDNEIFIKHGSALIKLKLKDIIYIEALENYITLNTENGKFTIHFTMNSIANQLPAGIFIRVHRSFIVAKNMIKTINETSLDIIFGDQIKDIPLGKSYKDALLNSLNVMTK